MILGGGLSQKCLFLHLPKCGGTSLAEALYATVPMQRRVAVVDAFSTRRAAAILHFGRDDVDLCHDDHANGALTFALRNAIVLTHLCWDTQLIHGHVLFTPEVERFVLPQYRLVTMMRDPVSRAVSNLREAIATGTASGDVEAWLAGPIARQHAMVNLRYLSGRQTVAPDEETACLKLALARLPQFALVGFIDEVPTFLARFRDMFGVRLELGHANEARAAAITLTADQQARLEGLCALDLQIHERAKALFG